MVSEGYNLFIAFARDGHCDLRDPLYLRFGVHPCAEALSDSCSGVSLDSLGRTEVYTTGVVVIA